MQKLGIIGGGQLSYMICEAAHQRNVDCISLDQEEAPAHQISKDSVIGLTTDGSKYKDLADKSDVLTIEIEKIDIDALNKLNIVPSYDCLKILCNKFSQKNFLKKEEIPTADFFEVKSIDELKSNKNGKLILKLATGGYDGRGVFSWPSEDVNEELFSSQVYAENKQDIKKELAMIVSRNAKGQIKTFPATEMSMRHDNQLDYLFSPANIEHDIEKQMESICHKIVSALSYQGVMAVEFFLTQSDELLVNEIAPRCHNSGHHTIEACESSQFDHVVACAFNEDLPETNLKKPSALLNLIGLTEQECEELIPSEMKEAYLHYYHKKARPGRKVGHICFMADRLEEAIDKLKQVQKRMESYV
ncbi:MAG: 5-(carboxyamino)imidazole ribonucleotide synthase [Bdellovibrionales bacterium]|nr:5-(carboxyamino)imidazole ribonucleotide synthase [Bdellovibrionales bacterium]